MDNVTLASSISSVQATMDFLHMSKLKPISPSYNAVSWSPSTAPKYLLLWITPNHFTTQPATTSIIDALHVEGHFSHALQSSNLTIIHGRNLHQCPSIQLMEFIVIPFPYCNIHIPFKNPKRLCDGDSKKDRYKLMYYWTNPFNMCASMVYPAAGVLAHLKYNAETNNNLELLGVALMLWPWSSILVPHINYSKTKLNSKKINSNHHNHFHLHRLVL